MRYDWLLDETKDEPPCGPNLELEDPEYFTYLLTAEGLLPASFFKFDRTTIDLKGESEKLENYLKECRDLRLLCLEARFRILFGQAPRFFECILGIEALVRTYWDEVYPLGEDGDFFLRSGAIATLEDIKTAILPLEYAPLANDRRHGDVTYRAYRVAKGDVPAREGETALDNGQISEVLASDDHREEIDTLHELATGARKALKDIVALFNEKAGYDQSPNFDGLLEAIEGIRDLLVEVRPDLAAAEPEEAEGEGEDQTEDGDGTETSGAVQSGTGETTVISQTVVVAGVEITNKDHAQAALLAAATYFANHEPSNPALIIVHQAHSLVGKSFVEAMQILVPGSVGGAELTVLADKDLKLNIEQMRSLSSEALQLLQLTNATEDINRQDDHEFSAKIRPEAIALIRGVEQFYRANEPSSPIPMLLAKARKYLNMDFEVILADMLPEKTPETSE